MAYDTHTKATLSRELYDVLSESLVQPVVARWLADRNIVKLTAFADLADSKQEIIAVVGRTAGLDPNDPLACQPLKTAWRQADALVRANLEARAKGEEDPTDMALTADQRHKLDSSVISHYRFTWPATLLPDDTIMGRLSRFYAKRTRYVPRLHEVKSILERADKGGKVLLRISHTAQQVTGIQTQGDDFEISGIWQFQHRHHMLMIAYAQAIAPDFLHADLTVLLDYRYWVMQKSLESRGRARPTIPSLMEADLQMRTKWMLSYVQNEFVNLTETVRHHRGQSAYLFAGLLMETTSPGYQDPDDGVRQAAKRLRDISPHSRISAKGSPQKGRGKGRGKQPMTPQKSFKLVPQTASGRPICRFYNRGACNRGDQCDHDHSCDFPDCGKRHARKDHHPSKPN